MSDNQPLDPDAIEALLRTPQKDDAPPATEAELDTDFDAIMSFLDNVDEEQAAELDDVATRARNDLNNSIEERPPDRQIHFEPVEPRVPLWEVIPPPSNPRVRIKNTVFNIHSRPSRLKNMSRPLVSRAMLVTTLALTTASAVTLMLAGYGIVQALPVLTALSAAVAALLARLREHK